MKRFLAIIVISALCFSIVPQIAVAAATYDPTKAVAWAKNSNNVNNTGGACATFVSTCLRKGGLTDVKKTYPGQLVEYLEKKGYGTVYKITDANLSKLKAGDVIAVFCSKSHDSDKYWGIHAIFVTEVNQSARYIRYSSRNSSHCNSKMTFDQLKVYAKDNSFKCSKCGSTKNNYSVFVSMKVPAKVVSTTPSPTPSSLAPAVGVAIPKVSTYTIKYVSNPPLNSSGSKMKVSGSMANSTMTVGEAATLRKNSYSIMGYSFSGWNTKANGTGTRYSDKESVKNLIIANGATVTLYAQWKKIAKSDLKPSNHNAAVTYSDVTSIVNEYYNTVGGNAYWNMNIHKSKDKSANSKMKSMPYLSTITHKACSNGCKSNRFNGIGTVLRINDPILHYFDDSQCSGFAAYIEYIIFKKTKMDSTWKVYVGKELPKDYVVKPGDQIRTNPNWNPKGGASHSRVIYKVSGNTAYYIECNWNGCCHIHKDSVKISTLMKAVRESKHGFLISSPAIPG